MIELATCSWRKYRPEQGLAVRITLGKPPAWFRHEHEEIRLLAPPPRVFRLDDWGEFIRAYTQHLEAVGVDRLRRVFDGLSQRHDGARLVLLCFESDPRDCHRALFSSFWQRETGQEVPELGSPSPRGTRTRSAPRLFDGEEDG